MAVAVGCMVALAVAAPTALGAFPGKNGRIFFDASHKGVLSIFSMRADGGDVERLANPTGRSVVAPSVSPQGKIAFSTVGTNHYDIYVMNLDGTDLHQLTHDGAGNGSPSFCGPNGGRLVWADAHSRVRVMQRNGSHKKVLARAGPLDNPACSPDGKRAVFTDRKNGREDLYSVRLSGHGLKRLTQVPKKGFALNPDFSPNSKSIVFDAGKRVSGARTGIFTMKLDGTHERRLTPESQSAFDPSYSPNGKRIVFAVSRGADELDDLYVMRRDGSHIHRVHGAGLGPAPDWAVRGS